MSARKSSASARCSPRKPLQQSRHDDVGGTYAESLWRSILRGSAGRNCLGATESNSTDISAPYPGKCFARKTNVCLNGQRHRVRFRGCSELEWIAAIDRSDIDQRTQG